MTKQTSNVLKTFARRALRKRSPASPVIVTSMVPSANRVLQIQARRRPVCTYTSFLLCLEKEIISVLPCEYTLFTVEFIQKLYISPTFHSFTGAGFPVGLGLVQHHAQMFAFELYLY